MTAMLKHSAAKSHTLDAQDVLVESLGFRV
jgi:hypothetical protein